MAEAAKTEVEKFLDEKKPVIEKKLTFSSNLEKISDLYALIVDWLKSKEFKVEKIRGRMLVSELKGIEEGIFARRGQLITQVYEQYKRLLMESIQRLHSREGIWEQYRRIKWLEESINGYEKEKDPKKKRQYLRRLKTYWLNNVEWSQSVMTGQPSIHNLRGAFPSLIDFFMIVDTPEDLEKYREAIVNEKIYGILATKIDLFWDWYKRTKERLPLWKEQVESFIRAEIANLEMIIENLRLILHELKAYKIAGSEEEYMFPFGRHSTVLFCLLANKDSSKDKKWKIVFLIDSSGKLVTRRRVTPHGAAQEEEGEITINLKAYALSEDDFKKLQEAMERDKAKVVEDVIGKEYANLLQKIKEEFKDVLKEKEKKKEEKKEEKKKKKKEWEITPERYIFLYLAYCIYKKLFKREKKEKKKEDKKKEVKKEVEELFTDLEGEIRDFFKVPTFKY